MILYNYQRVGLYNKLFYKCELCNYIAKVTIDSEEDFMGVNKSAGLGCNASGIDHAQTKKMLSALGVPFMSPRTYIKLDFEVFENMKNIGKIEMKKAGERSRKAAIERGDFIEVDGEKYGIIRVTVDGCWCKKF